MVCLELPFTGEEPNRSQTRAHFAGDVSVALTIREISAEFAGHGAPTLDVAGGKQRARHQFILRDLLHVRIGTQIDGRQSRSHFAVVIANVRVADDLFLWGQPLIELIVAPASQAAVEMIAQV